MAELDAPDQLVTLGLDEKSDLVTLAGAEHRPIKIIPFPGERGKRNDKRVGLFNLTDYETRCARIDSIKYLTDIAKLTELHLAMDPGLGSDEYKSQVLWRAMRRATDHSKHFARTVNEVRVHLTPDEREALWLAYCEWVDERSPIKRVTSAQELEELVTALGKGSPLLESYDSISLRNIVRSLADRVQELTSKLLQSTSPSSGESDLSSLAHGGG